MAQVEEMNGKAHVAREKQPRARLELTFDPATFALHVGGEFENYDMALAMLAQATRYFEAELRKANMLQLQQQMVEQQRNAAIAATIRGRA